MASQLLFRLSLSDLAILKYNLILDPDADPNRHKFKTRSSFVQVQPSVKIKSA